jgi:hypothetical protein
MKLETQNSYITNPQFVGGVAVTSFLSGSNFTNASDANPQFGFTAGGLYVGNTGDLTVKTYDGSVLTFVSASGFIPGIVVAVSGSSTARGIVALR